MFLFWDFIAENFKAILLSPQKSRVHRVNRARAVVRYPLVAPTVPSQAKFFQGSLRIVYYIISDPLPILNIKSLWPNIRLFTVIENLLFSAGESHLKPHMLGSHI